MASVGIRKRVSARTGRVTYQVWWLLDDGSQGALTVATPAEARELQAEKQLEIAKGAWQSRRRGRLTFDRWADAWWAVWSTDPDRSPTTLAATENRLRRHIRPHGPGVLSIRHDSSGSIRGAAQREHCFCAGQGAAGPPSPIRTYVS